MSLTKVSYSMITGAPFNVLDYSSLAATVTAKDPGDGNSHLFTSFLSWRLPIQAALDAANAAGGGSVVIPKNTVPYYLDDYIYIHANTTLVCEDWLVLADYTTVGHTVQAYGDNILVQNLLLDNSDLYAGGSGQNGITAGQGKNIKFYAGEVKNCKSGNNNDGTGDGGKGVQLEPGDGEDILFEGMTFSSCFMAMSTIREYTETAAYYGIVYNNITADNCSIFFFASQVNGYDQTGLEHSVQLNNFYAVNCGSFEGVFQFSRASNVKISNGIVVADPATSPGPLIRGHHANCTFENVGYYGDTNALILTDASTYAVDESYPNNNNYYDLNSWGTVSYLANSTIGASYNTLDNCSGKICFTTAPTVGWFSYDMRNGTSVFEVSCNTGPFGASKFATLVTSANYIGSSWPEKFSELDTGNTQFLKGIGFVGGASARSDILDYYEQGTFSPDVSATSGSGATYTSLGSYIRVGDLVTARGVVTFTGLGTLSGRLIIGNLPFPASSSDQGWYGSARGTYVTLANAMSLACSTSTASYSAVTFPWTPNNGGAGSEIQIADIASNSEFRFTVTYRV